MRSVGYSELFVLSRLDVLAAFQDYGEAEVVVLLLFVCFCGFVVVICVLLFLWCYCWLSFFL